MATKKKTAEKAGQTAQEAPEAVQEEQTPQTDSEGTQASQTAQKAPELVRVDSPIGLNLREGPGHEFSVAQKLENGAVLAVLELPCGAQVPGWTLVHTGQRPAGWVMSRYLRALEQTAGAE